MSKLELQAIRKLPDNYIVDGTITARCFDDYIVAMNPNLPLIIFKNGEWTPALDQEFKK